jgi:regulator of protease activity HflC (stomatin/prohibitin superfamily)
VKSAFDKVVASQREKEAAINQAEAYRIRKVEEARAEAESIMLKSRAYVESRMEIISLAKNQLNVDDNAALTLISGIDYRDALRDVAKSGSLIVVPHGFSDANSAVLTTEILKKYKNEKSNI